MDDSGCADKVGDGVLARDESALERRPDWLLDTSSSPSSLAAAAGESPGIRAVLPPLKRLLRGVHGDEAITSSLSSPCARKCSSTSSSSLSSGTSENDPSPSLVVAISSSYAKSTLALFVGQLPSAMSVYFTPLYGISDGSPRGFRRAKRW